MNRELRKICMLTISRILAMHNLLLASFDIDSAAVLCTIKRYLWMQQRQKFSIVGFLERNPSSVMLISRKQSHCHCIVKVDKNEGGNSRFSTQTNGPLSSAAHSDGQAASAGFTLSIYCVDINLMPARNSMHAIHSRNCIVLSRPIVKSGKSREAPQISIHIETSLTKKCAFLFISAAS